MELALHYEMLQSHPAFQHWWGRIQRIEEKMHQALLRGVSDAHGNDVTPYLRASYGTLLQMMSIPAEVARAKEHLEETMLEDLPVPRSRQSVDVADETVSMLDFPSL